MRITYEETEVFIAIASLCALAGGSDEPLQSAADLARSLDENGWLESRWARRSRWRAARNEATEEARRLVLRDSFDSNKAFQAARDAAEKAARDSFPSFSMWWTEDEE